MANFGPIAADIGPVVWGTPANFNGFRVLAALYCTALQYWASAKLCGIEQRTPPIFGRATITLGIGPHSSLLLPSPCVPSLAPQYIRIIRRHANVLLFVAAGWNRAGHYIFTLWFLLSFFFLLLFPRLISAVADWMSTILPHMVWP